MALLIALGTGALACGRSVTNGDLDARATELVDGSSPGRDGARRDDASETPDEPLRFDDVVAPAVDVPLLPDGAPDPTASLEGAWRLLRYEFTTDDGRRAQITHEGGPLEVSPGATVDARVNGTLRLTAMRLAYTLGILANEHFFAREDTDDAATALSAYGISATGTLAGDRFALSPTSSVAFSRNPDGTISHEEEPGGARTTWARTSELRGPIDAFRARGRAFVLGGDAGATFDRPRAVLAWDGPSGRREYTNDVALTRSVLGGFEYPVAVEGAPPMLTTIGAARVAVAVLLAYEDRDRSGSYEPERDTLRGVSPIALTFRAGRDPALQGTVFRNVPEGYALANVQLDAPAARRTLEGFDLANPVSPDLVLARETFTGEIPDFVR